MKVETGDLKFLFNYFSILLNKKTNVLHVSFLIYGKIAKVEIIHPQPKLPFFCSHPYNLNGFGFGSMIDSFATTDKNDNNQLGKVFDYLGDSLHLLITQPTYL
ncbi:hypothetical protein DDT91_18495 [Algoriphagus sp. AK58]|nr:hypothetical protein [Algoriphagus sp. AK58]